MGRNAGIASPEADMKGLKFLIIAASAAAALAVGLGAQASSHSPMLEARNSDAQPGF
jgi:hypothetical protein